MKLSNILLALGLLFFAACGSKTAEEHGHEHGPDADHAHSPDGHSHEGGDHTEQEEFTFTSDSTAKKPISIH
jgi:hypothetical protein